jgi:peptide deformylase
MKLPPIMQVGASVLRNRAIEVAPMRIGTPAFQKLVDLMITVMHEAPGVGLAAPQIGIPWRVIVLEDRAEILDDLEETELKAKEREAFEPRVFINPVLKPIGERTATFREGCLSVDGFSADVERWLEVEVTGLDRDAKPQTWRVAGWPARILQHECDHLDGTLYIDRMKSRTYVSPIRVPETDTLEALKKSLGIV